MITTAGKVMRLLALTGVLAVLAGCDDPNVYGSVGISSGYGHHGGWSPRVRTSVSVGGRIR